METTSESPNNTTEYGLMTEADRIKLLYDQNEALVRENKELSLRVEQLAEMYRNLQKMYFGRSSEKRRYVLADGVEQLSLFDEAESEANAKEPELTIERITYDRKRKPKRTKEELAKNLPVKEEVITLPEDSRSCDICEGILRPIGKTMVRRELVVVPAQYYVKELYAQTYACDTCEKETEEANIVRAEVPVPVVKRGLASAESVAYVMVQKYINAMPLYRQEQDMANYGVYISRATLANWVIYVADHWLKPLYDAMKKVLISLLVIHADETAVQVLKEPGRAPSSQSRMWVYASGIATKTLIVLYEYQPTRSGEHAGDFLKGFTGYLQTDGYVGYDTVADVIRCGCWAHLRRKFEEALPSGEKKNESKAAVGLDYCNRLFKLEADWADLTPQERHERRQTESKPVLDAFWTWLNTVNPLQGSALGKAVTYANNQRSSLNAFLADGHISISNNRAENVIRPFVVGRKNWLFSDTPRGAKAGALVYSVLVTAKENGLNPFVYLTYLFSNLPSVITNGQLDRLPEFFPWSLSLPHSCRKSKA